MINNQEQQALNLLARKVAFAITEELGALYDRWGDEQEYEDWADYIGAMRKLIEGAGGHFVRGMRRPFGCIFSLTSPKGFQAQYKVTANAREIKYKMINGFSTEVSK